VGRRAQHHRDPAGRGVLQPWGIVLSPAIAAILMFPPYIIVALNAQFLCRVAL
jgi:Cu2+-exporting ATPase